MPSSYTSGRPAAPAPRHATLCSCEAPRVQGTGAGPSSKTLPCCVAARCAGGWGCGPRMASLRRGIGSRGRQRPGRCCSPTCRKPRCACGAPPPQLLPPLPWLLSLGACCLPACPPPASTSCIAAHTPALRCCLSCLRAGGQDQESGAQGPAAGRGRAAQGRAAFCRQGRSLRRLPPLPPGARRRSWLAASPVRWRAAHASPPLPLLCSPRHSTTAVPPCLAPHPDAALAHRPGRLPAACGRQSGGSQRGGCGATAGDRPRPRGRYETRWGDMRAVLSMRL